MKVVLVPLVSRNSLTSVRPSAQGDNQWKAGELVPGSRRKRSRATGNICRATSCTLPSLTDIHGREKSSDAWMFPSLRLLGQASMPTIYPLCRIPSLHQLSYFVSLRPELSDSIGGTHMTPQSPANITSESHDQEGMVGIRAWTNAFGFQLRAMREPSEWRFEAYSLANEQLLFSEAARSEEDAREKALRWITKRAKWPVSLRWNQ